SRRVVLGLLSQAADMDRDRAGVERGRVSPHARHELVAGEHAARVAREEPDQLELLRGQTYLGATLAQFPCRPLESHVAELEPLGGLARGRRSAEDGADARGKLSRGEGLR